MAHFCDDRTIHTLSNKTDLHKEKTKLHYTHSKILQAVFVCEMTFLILPQKPIFGTLKLCSSIGQTSIIKHVDYSIQINLV